MENAWGISGRPLKYVKLSLITAVETYAKNKTNYVIRTVTKHSDNHSHMLFLFTLFKS